MSGHVFLEILDLLNRKERFHLLKMATGLKIDPTFLNKVCNEVDFEPPEKIGCFFGFDYHIDWLEAAVQLTDWLKRNSLEYSTEWVSKMVKNVAKNPFENREFGKQKTRIITGTQEDIDCLVAFERRDHDIAIILIEAKGDTGWKRDQLESKLSRLNEIFKPEWIDARFLMTSPWKPGIQVKESWEDFSRLGIKKGKIIPHINLPKGNSDSHKFLLKVTRIDNSENGYKSWKFDKRNWG